MSCQWEPGDSYCPVHGPEICGCDEALALRARVQKAEARVRELEDAIGQPCAMCGSTPEELQEFCDWRYGAGTRASKLDEAESALRALRTELAQTRFLSVLRGKLATAWAKMLDAKRAELDETQVAYFELEAELAEAERRLREDKHADNTLEWRHMVDELRTEIAEANNRWHSACDVGRRLEVRNDQLLTELEEAHTLQPLQLCTPAERKVLDAIPRLLSLLPTAEQLKADKRLSVDAKHALAELAELARRGEAP
jgi:hypothetical protein